MTDFKDDSRTNRPDFLKNALTPKEDKPAKKERDANDPRNKPGYVPAYHASQQVTNNAVKAQKESLDRKGEHKLPESAKPVEDAYGVVYAPLPAGGIAHLAETLFDDDYGDDEKMGQHVQDLLNMNRESVRTETDYRVGQTVRIR
jgi:hypothetical protein